MERWQESSIKKHLPNLVKYTKCNTLVQTILIQEGILDQVDLDILNGNEEGDMNVSYKLYNLLLGRTHSYKIIGKATYNANQSGAFCILLKGLVQHMLEQIGVPLHQRIGNVLSAQCMKKETVEFFLSKVDDATLHESSWIPKLNGELYIERRISNRVKLEPDVFRQKCEDVFVFIKIGLSELSKLVEPNKPRLSKTVIFDNRAIAEDIKFILLEDEREWEILRNILLRPLQKNNIRPVHLIRYESNSMEYILVDSTQPSDSIRNFVPHHLRNKSLYVFEKEFCDEIIRSRNRRAICICDTPGMGKSWLLGNMARYIQHNSSGTMVAFIELAVFVRRVNMSSDSNSPPLKILLEYLCKHPLTSALLTPIISQGNIHFELFLDGFDEIPAERLNAATLFFTLLAKSSKNVTLYVTSRPHKRKELEQTFGAVASDILGFSEKEQVNYLVAFWQEWLKNNKRTGLDAEKCNIFAVACLERLKNALTQEESDLMGIPLQCLLLARMNTENVQMFCYQNRNDNAVDYCSVFSMYDMYKRYIVLGIEKATVKEASTQVSTNERENKQKYLQAFHVWKALQLIYPVLANDYFQSENLSEETPSSEVFACGILLKPSNTDDLTAHFLHRTFAEYLVAELFSQIVTGKHTFKKDDLLRKFIKVFVQDVLFTNEEDRRRETNTGWLDFTPLQFTRYRFAHTVLTSFLNAGLLLRQEDCPPGDVARHIVSLVEEGTFAPILSACIASNNRYIILLLKHVISRISSNQEKYQQDDIRELLQYSSQVDIYDEAMDDHKLSCCAYLCHAAETSNVLVVEEVHSLFQKCLGEDLNQIWVNTPTSWKTPLDYAAERHDFELVNHFVDHIALPQERLLYLCVQKTSSCSSDEIAKIIEICRRVRDKCTPSYEDKEFINPLFAEEVHVDLIKFLIDMEFNVTATTDEGQNLLTHCAVQMSKGQFCELCKFLIVERKEHALFKPNLAKWGDPLPAIVGFTDDETLKNILEIPNLKMRGVDPEENNLILATIKNNGTLSTVETLLKYGVDLYKTNDKGENALHLAAQGDRLDTVTFLVGKGFSLASQDGKGNTPLHLAAGNAAMMKHLVSLGNATFYEVNSEGNNVAHLAAEQIWGHEVLDYLVTLEGGKVLLTKINEEGKTPIDILFEKAEFPQMKNIETVLSFPEAEIPKMNKMGESIFLMAVSTRQNVSTLQLLANNKADVLAVNSKNQNALHLVAASGNLETLKYLISLGLPLECRDLEGNTPLLLSAGNIEVAKYLILHKANPKAVDNNRNNIAHKFRGVVEFRANQFTNKDYHSLFKEINNAGRTPLHEWIASGVSLNKKTIKNILKISGEKINDADKLGRTMFMNAALAEKHNSEVLKCLFEQGSNPQQADIQGQNALHLAAEIGYLATARYVNSLGVSWETRDAGGNTPLLLTAHIMYMLKAFIATGTNILAKNHNGDNIAHMTFRKTNKRRNTLRDKIALHILMLKEGPQLFQMENKSGRTPLHEWLVQARRPPKVETVKRIIKKCGIDVNKGDTLGNTMVLSAAMRINNMRILKCLCTFKADCNAVNKEGDSALHLAIRWCGDEKESLRMIKYLANTGCYSDHENNEGFTPLQLARAFVRQGKFSEGAFQEMCDVLLTPEEKSTEYLIRCILRLIMGMVVLILALWWGRV